MDKPLVWLKTELKTPPLSEAARIEAGVALRRLQRGERLEMPLSRTMPSIGARVHELRIRDGKGGVFWRIVYRVDEDAIVIAAVFKKKDREDTFAGGRVEPATAKRIRPSGWRLT